MQPSARILRRATLDLDGANRKPAALHAMSYKRGMTMAIAGFLILVCGLAALAYLVLHRMKVDEERDRHETRIMRDIPPPPGSAGV